MPRFHRVSPSMARLSSSLCLLAFVVAVASPLAVTVDAARVSSTKRHRMRHTQTETPFISRNVQPTVIYSTNKECISSAGTGDACQWTTLDQGSYSGDFPMTYVYPLLRTPTFKPEKLTF